MPQHTTVPALRSAHVCSPPAVIWIASPRSPTSRGTGAGGWLCPCLPPQHATLPERCSAQVWYAPVETWVASSSTATATGLGWLVIVPSPSCELKLTPQHRILPSRTTAQAWPGPRPTSICCASSRPATITGCSRVALVSSPSWPSLLFPQHVTLPDSSRAQV